MKLNDKGFGLMQMMIISGVLLLLLLFAAYYIYIFYSKLDVNTGSEYAFLESKLQTSAIKYVIDEKIDNNKIHSLSYELLLEKGYIDDFYDDNENECNGYVIIRNSDYKTYIKCDSYKSSGYNDTYE